MSFNLGRKRPANLHSKTKLKLRDYLKALVLTPPPNADYSPAGMGALGNVYENDRLGDCVIAGGYHVIGVQTGNAGDLFIASDDQIISDYSAIGGYVRGRPWTDNGCDEVTALNYWTSNGFADGTKISGYVTLDATNEVEVQQALYLFENVYLGLELPDAYVNPFPQSSNFTWDVAGSPDPNNGHCIMGCGYGANGITIGTWGMTGIFTYAALGTYCIPSAGGECYAILTPDIIAKATNKAPNGFDFATLTADLAALAPAA
jgi:hypothetical protein